MYATYMQTSFIMISIIRSCDPPTLLEVVKEKKKSLELIKTDRSDGRSL